MESREVHADKDGADDQHDDNGHQHTLQPVGGALRRSGVQDMITML
jgi:hypothetical protein